MLVLFVLQIEANIVTHRPYTRANRQVQEVYLH
jgi:hypothetical protein